MTPVGRPEVITVLCTAALCLPPRSWYELPDGSIALKLFLLPCAGSRESGMNRVDWHTYFMNMAKQAATRSTCDRKYVGAVIVRLDSV